MKWLLSFTRYSTTPKAVVRGEVVREDDTDWYVRPPASEQVYSTHEQALGAAARMLPVWAGLEKQVQYAWQRYNAIRNQQEAEVIALLEEEQAKAE